MSVRKGCQKTVDHLQSALAALENPEQYCRDHGHDYAAHSAEAYAAGAAIARLKFALAELGAEVK